MAMVAKAMVAIPMFSQVMVAMMMLAMPWMSSLMSDGGYGFGGNPYVGIA